MLRVNEDEGYVDCECLLTDTDEIMFEANTVV